MIEVKDRVSGQVLVAVERVPYPGYGSIESVLNAEELAELQSYLHLENVSLSGMDLRRASLNRANLLHANLTNSNLTEADLSEAYLFGADLRGSNLTSADLRGSSLHMADLSGAVLENALLKSARYSKTTRWPQGIDPKALGAFLVEQAP